MLTHTHQHAHSHLYLLRSNQIIGTLRSMIHCTFCVLGFEFLFRRPVSWAIAFSLYFSISSNIIINFFHNSLDARNAKMKNEIEARLKIAEQ